ncbi:MAG: TRAP transporter permease, partial [Desulfovibrionaceae bacterium]|nr:TRAP transporter permease [Desulfovibrionaceae bacterium]
MPHSGHPKVNAEQLLEISQKETGRRRPRGIPYYTMLGVALAWALFQLWIISPLPFSLGVGVFNATAVRSLHLSFAIFLAYISFPMLKSIRMDHIPWIDWALAFIAAFCTSYLYFFQDYLISRAGSPTTLDIAVACVGVLLLLEATRRVMGFPMTVVASVFLLYVFLGPYAPDLIAHRGASLSRAASQIWLTQEGVFGVPLGVSVDFVFMYVLFGAMLERGGAGNYLTTLSFALLGHFRGGPAKAAVVASGLHGLISGSSIANVLTCGPVTIMLMKKVGFSAEKAGAVEVAAGSNGQIMPPVMGAAAFLMIEYIGMPYEQLIRHAFLPAVLAYASLLYIVHLEACKLNMQSAPRRTPLHWQFIGLMLSLAGIIILAGVAYFLTFWIPDVFGEASSLVFALLLASLYFGLLYVSTRYPELPEKPEVDMDNLPPVIPTLLAGIYFMLPIATLVWCLMVLKLSPGLAAFYACMLMSLILLTQNPILAWMRKKPLGPALRKGANSLFDSLIAGSRNMVGIALATATAGIIVGSVSLTGIGQVLAAVVETVSMGILPLVLVFTAILALILGMGLPTTANYIIVSTLLAPIIYNLAAANGLAVPLVGVHLFCLYFGVMADATPPVALAAFAASGISGGDPFKTGVQGFFYEMRTAILPFVFVYNPEILLIGIQSAWHLIWVIFTATLACLCFASVTQRFMLTRTRWWELALLVAAMIALFRPTILQDLMYDPYERHSGGQVLEQVEKLAPG